MATEKQIEANRLNAQKSTWPRTPQGKVHVSMNSLRHGMRARAVVLPKENEGRFHQLCDELEAEWQPQSTTESALLEKMAAAQWKLQKIGRQTFAPPAQEAPSARAPAPCADPVYQTAAPADS